MHQTVIEKETTNTRNIKTLSLSLTLFSSLSATNEKKKMTEKKLTPKISKKKFNGIRAEKTLTRRGQINQNVGGSQNQIQPGKS